jgi:hypothetical protein
MIEKLAQESSKTERDRRKLEKQFKEIDSQVTPEALQDCTNRICERINRLAPFRVSVNNGFGLFDSNQNSQNISEKVSKIAQSIRGF